MVSSALVFSEMPFALAAHGSSLGGGGGCIGECEPPTLGVDEQGVIRVENGLVINSKSFNVNQFSQNIPTQLLETGKSNFVTENI